MRNLGVDNKMGNMFAAMAQKAVANSQVREGRERISTEEIISHYPDGVTITEFDMLSKRNGVELTTFPTFAFAEDDTKYFNGGTSLKKIVDEWLQHFEGDIDACNAALKAAGGCKIRLLPSIRTGNGNNFVPVEVLG